MAESKERRPLPERETLMYATPEQAASFRERVQEKVRAADRRAVQRPREVVAEAVAEEFAQEGYGVTNLSQPWEHSPAEHAEAQALVDLAFAADLTTALKRAKQSPAWPRNVDLFHDVLTTEMYDLVREHKLNRQPLGGWLVLALGILAAALLIAVVVIVLAVTNSV